MAEVITVVDMMKFDQLKKAVFQEGTILTPSAKDWAMEHHIQIVIGEDTESEEAGSDEKAAHLKQVVAAVFKNLSKTEGDFHKEDIYEIIARSLQRLGFNVE